MLRLPLRQTGLGLAPLLFTEDLHARPRPHFRRHAHARLATAREMAVIHITAATGRAAFFQYRHTDAALPRRR
ncbi:hypothetical protein G6F57_023190 [Rhizopus arrhizus]|nr:hypothetical protein G6F57_023190 [Rhizopus arrhizus]